MVAHLCNVAHLYLSRAPNHSTQPCSMTKLQKLQATITRQQQQIETLTAQLKEQASQIKKVSAQLEVSKPAVKVVNNP